MRHRLWGFVALAVLAAAGVVVTSSGEREDPPLGPRVSPSHDVDPSQTLAAPERRAEVEERGVDELPAYEAVVLEVDRTRNVIAALARELEPANYDASRWRTRLSATAHELGTGSAPFLVALGHDATTSATENAAAAELLRVLRTEACRDLGQLAPEALVRLREDVHAPAALRRVPLAVGARALAAWGDRLDQARLLDVALASEEDAERGVLLAALGSSQDPQTALELAGIDDPRAQVALAAMARESGWSFDESVSAAVGARLEDRLMDPRANAALRLRALFALPAWSRERSEAVLPTLAADPETPAELVREVARRIAGTGETSLIEETLHGPNQVAALAIGEALAARISRDGDAALFDTVLDTLREGTHPERPIGSRVRAVHALGRMTDPAALEAIAATLRHDGDPTVRAAAVVALRGHPRSETEPLLSEAAERDPALRALCRHELGRTD